MTLTTGGANPIPPRPLVEAPVYREAVGLWEHQKHFVKLAFDAHRGPHGARFVLADQVGLGKTLQLAMAAQLMALVGDRAVPVLAPKSLVWQWQDEMHTMLGLPSAVWSDGQWLAGRRTVARILDGWTAADQADDDAEPSEGLRTLTDAERRLLGRLGNALDNSSDRDPKCTVVSLLLLEEDWLSRGCIVFSQYYDSIRWLGAQLSEDLADETIGIYAGTDRSGMMRGGVFERRDREAIKDAVRRGALRLVLGTDAASEGLNLQRLGTLINLDLPWIPSRLEQRKGRIQRIGQVCSEVDIYNLRYAGSVEDRVHELLSARLESISRLFGQLPDTLEDVWVRVALGQIDEASKTINALPQEHPFELRCREVRHVDWESCARVLSGAARRRCLEAGW